MKGLRCFDLQTILVHFPAELRLKLNFQCKLLLIYYSPCPVWDLLDKNCQTEFESEKYEDRMDPFKIKNAGRKTSGINLVKNYLILFPAPSHFPGHLHWQ